MHQNAPEKWKDDGTPSKLTFSSIGSTDTNCSDIQTSAPIFTKWDGTPPTNPLFPSQFATYKSETFYSGVHDWTRTSQANKHLSVAISAYILAYLHQSASSMFLNDTRFASDSTARISCLLTHLNPSSSENILLVISYLTRLDMELGETIIQYNTT